MKKTSLLRATIGSVASIFCVFLPSCVNDEYEMSEDRLDLEATVFQEGVVLPLGSTSRIKIADLLDQLDPEVAEYFSKNAEGGYSLGLSGDYNLSKELDFIKDIADLKAISLDRKFSFSFVNADVSGLTFGPYEYPYEKYLSSVIRPVEIDIPQITSGPVSMTVPVDGYVPSEDDMKISSLNDYDFTGKVATLNITVPIPEAARNDVEIPLDHDIEGVAIETFNKFDMSRDPVSVAVRFELPSLVKSVSEVEFNDQARVKLSVELSNSFFKSGNIIPHVTMDLHDVFHLNGISNDVIKADFILNEADGYAADNVYYIKSMVVAPEDVKEVDGKVYFEKSITVNPVVTLDMDGLTTTTRLLAEHNGEDVNAHVMMEFLDFAVSDVVMSVNPVKEEIVEEIPVKVPEIKVPDFISGVEEVMLADGAGFDLSITASGLSGVSGLDLSLGDIELTFPEEIRVEGADAYGRLAVAGGSLKSGSLNRHIEVRALKPGAVKDGKLSFDGKIGVRALAEAGGTDIHTSQLMGIRNIGVEVGGVGQFYVEDYRVAFDGYEQKIEIEPYQIKEPVSADIAELGKISVELDGDPTVTIDIDLPETDIPVTASSEGLSVEFPDMLVFGDGLPDGFDRSSNTLRLSGEISRDPIVLPIRKLLIEAEKIGEEWFVTDEIKVTGGVAIQAAVVTKDDVDAITSADAKVAFNAYVSELKPLSVGIDEYTASVKETVGFDGLDLGDLPKELVSVGNIDLDNVYFNLKVKAPGLKDIVKESDVALDLEIALPSVIKVDEDRMVNGILPVSGVLDMNEEIVIDPVKIAGLDLSGIDLKAENPFKDVCIDITGQVSVKNAVIDLASLENATFNLDVDGMIKTEGLKEEKIRMSRVTGVIDYQMEPVTQTLELSELMSALNTENLHTTLDINRFGLKLDVETNLKVPVEASISLTPYKGETAGETLTLSSPVKLNCPEISGQSAFTRLWISNTEEGMPEGYSYVNLDVVSMLADMPDCVDFTISAGTGPEAECEIVPSVDYMFKADYAAELPIEFGDDFCLEFEETIGDLPKELGDILKMGSLALVGEITSSLPLQLEMKASLLDSEGKAVELAENAGTLLIRPCAPDGSPVRTDVNLLLKVKHGTDVSDITSLGLYFKATAKGVGGVPVTDETFVQATLQALIPEGVTLDLGQYLEMEND